LVGGIDSSLPESFDPSGQVSSKPGADQQRLLRDRYYLGLVPYKPGTADEQIFPGRHKPLIDEATFDKVQALLDEHRVSGDRTQKHRHYLKGSVYCGECGSRLIYGPSRSKNGKVYDYFFCGSRIRGGGCQCAPISGRT
jgi:site-specific DNA recombinase